MHETGAAATMPPSICGGKSRTPRNAGSVLVMTMPKVTCSYIRKSVSTSTGGCVVYGWIEKSPTYPVEDPSCYCQGETESKADGHELRFGPVGAGSVFATWVAAVHSFRLLKGISVAFTR